MSQLRGKTEAAEGWTQGSAAAGGVKPLHHHLALRDCRLKHVSHPTSVPIAPSSPPPLAPQDPKPTAYLLAHEVVPQDVAVQGPGAGVVGDEADDRPAVGLHIMMEHVQRKRGQQGGVSEGRMRKGDRVRARGGERGR